LRLKIRYLAWEQKILGFTIKNVNLTYFFNSLSEWRTKLQPVVDSVADLALVVVVVDAVVAVDAGPVDVERRTPRSGCQ